MSTLSVAQALAEAKRSGVERLDAQLLLAHVLDRDRTWLLAHDEVRLNPDQETQLRSALSRRAGGEPLAYLLGHKEFHGLMLRVSPSVLVPRPETEILVDWALELLAGPLAGVKDPSVLDLGTGSGAIALAIKHAHPRARMLASDVSADALDVARANAERLGLEVDFVLGPWFEGWGAERFHLILSNPPYIAAEDPHLPALSHEPLSALTSGSDGLVALKTIATAAPEHLIPAGWLLMEHGYDQATVVCDALRRSGFQQVRTRSDLAGQPRCTGGQRLGS